MTNKSWILNRPITHRGVFDNKTIAENSASSIKKAIENNYAIELDVALTKDNVPIIFHDDSLSRMTNLNGYVSNTNFNDLKGVHLASTSDTILTLKEALNLVNGAVPLILDLKLEHNSNQEKFILECISSYSGELAIESFNPFVLEWFKLNAPSIIRGQLSASFHHEHPTFAKRGDLKNLKLNSVSEPNFISYKLEDAKMFRLKKFMKTTPLIFWTVKDKKGLEKAKKFNANIIFENIIPE